MAGFKIRKLKNGLPPTLEVGTMYLVLNEAEGDAVIHITTSLGEIKSYPVRSVKKELTDFVSIYDSNGYYYVGYNVDGVAVIKRYIGQVEETATGVTNLTASWNTRQTLTYV